MVKLVSTCSSQLLVEWTQIFPIAKYNVTDWHVSLVPTVDWDKVTDRHTIISGNLDPTLRPNSHWRVFQYLFQYGWFIRVKFVQVKHSQSVVQAQTIVIQSPLKFSENWNISSAECCRVQYNTSQKCEWKWSADCRLISLYPSLHYWDSCM